MERKREQTRQKYTARSDIIKYRDKTVGEIGDGKNAKMAGSWRRVDQMGFTSGRRTDDAHQVTRRIMQEIVTRKVP